MRNLDRGIRLRYLAPALGMSAVLAAGPIVALFGTTTLARYLFIGLLALLTLGFYHFRSWRKQIGVGMIAFAVELAFLVVVYLNPRFLFRQALADLAGQELAQLSWQITLGVAAIFLVAGSIILLWGIRAHKKPSSRTRFA